MRILLPFVALIILTTACRIKEKACMPSPMPVLLRIVSATGADLLNPSNPGSYNRYDLRMYTNTSAKENKLTAYSSLTSDSFYIETNIIENFDCRGTVFFLKLPGGDIDTITIQQKNFGDDCSTCELQSFNYNGKAYSRSDLVNTSYGVMKGFVVIK